VYVDDFDKCVIRNIIQDFYVQAKRVPTIRKLLPVIKEKIHFPWGLKSLGRVVKRMGFKWRKCQSKCKFLIERADIVAWRSKYLVKMKQYQEEGRPILYVDEPWVDSNLTFRKCWQSDDVMGIQTNVNSGNRLISQMNSANFEKWVVEKLVPNLPPHVVIVLDNAPYHCIQVDKPPSAYALKSDMISWLRNNGVDYNATMCKDSLYKLIVPLKPKEKAFKIYRILSDYGHTVVQLPPYMCNLNPIELAWAKIKRIVTEHNVTADLSLQKLLQTAHDK
jgi:transposase